MSRSFGEKRGFIGAPASGGASKWDCGGIVEGVRRKEPAGISIKAD